MEDQAREEWKGCQEGVGVDACRSFFIDNLSALFGVAFVNKSFLHGIWLLVRFNSAEYIVDDDTTEDYYDTATMIAIFLLPLPSRFWPAFRSVLSPDTSVSRNV